MSTFQERLLELRNQYNLTQQQMAEKLGITQPAYIRYENGTAEPKQAVLIKIADIFDVTIDYLIGRTNDL